AIAATITCSRHQEGGPRTMAWHYHTLALIPVVSAAPACFTVPPATYDANPEACPASSTVCDDATGHYVECSSSGVPQLEMDCPLGCATGVEKCLDVDPSNGLAPYLDQTLTDTDVTAVELSSDSTIDTDSGQVMMGASIVPV